jgi:hypothetical protein
MVRLSSKKEIQGSKAKQDWVETKKKLNNPQKI